MVQRITCQLKRSSRVRMQPRQYPRSSTWQIPRHGLWTGKNSSCSATPTSRTSLFPTVITVGNNDVLEVGVAEQLEFFPVQSPCRGICQVDERGYCRGCMRTRDERFNWHVIR